jgi:integrase
MVDARAYFSRNGLDRKRFPSFKSRGFVRFRGLAKAGCDVFTLARIAGHSSITITQRYVHPQADAIERAFLQTENTALPMLQLDAPKAR